MARRVDVERLLKKLGLEARRNGEEYEACCPNHQEKTPSWSIHGRTGAHYCFGCSYGGGVADLVLDVLELRPLAMDWRDAWRWIGEQGLLVGEAGAALSVELFLRVEGPRGFRLPGGVQVGLEVGRWPTPARRYLDERQIPDWQVRRWGLGFSVEGRLAGRFVLPVRDARGRLVSYSARSFTGELPRYKTPDAAERPEPAALFGEEGWPEPGERERVVVVEGGIKGLAVERAGGGCSRGFWAPRRRATGASPPSWLLSGRWWC